MKPGALAVLCPALSITYVCVCSVSCVYMYARSRLAGREVCRVCFQPSPRAAGNLRHATAPPHVSECLSLEGVDQGVVLRLQRMTD